MGCKQTGQQGQEPCALTHSPRPMFFHHVGLHNPQPNRSLPCPRSELIKSPPVPLMLSWEQSLGWDQALHPQREWFEHKQSSLTSLCSFLSRDRLLAGSALTADEEGEQKLFAFHALKQWREGEGEAGGTKVTDALHREQPHPRAVAPCCAVFVLSFIWEQSSWLFLSVL